MKIIRQEGDLEIDDQEIRIVVNHKGIEVYSLPYRPGVAQSFAWALADASGFVNGWKSAMEQREH